MAVARECSPSTSLDDYPCLKCLSVSQLKMALLYVLAVLNGNTLPDDLEAILANSACYNCTSETQKLQIIVTNLATLADAQFDLTAALESAKCLPCLQKGQVDAAIVQLLCTYLLTLAPD